MYRTPEIQFIEIDAKDIIVTSSTVESGVPGGDDNKTPDDEL